MREYFELCQSYDTETMLKVSFLLIIAIIGFYVFISCLVMIINLILDFINKRKVKKND